VKRAAVAKLVLALALVGCALMLARLVAAPGARGLELGRTRVTSVDPALADRLARGELDLLVQWFGPAAADRPAGYDGVENEVRAAFAALEGAAPERVRTQILRPDSDAEARLYAETLGLAPFRARRIVRDGWTDARVWSSLRTVVAGQGASVVRALTPDLGASTQALVAAGIAEVEAPRRPRIALSAPSGHTRLRALLRELGDVAEIDYDVDAQIPADADLLCWIAPSRVEPDHVARLRAFVERGGSAFVAASRFSARVDGDRIVYERATSSPAALYAELGLRADDRPLLEAPPTDAAGSASDWTWHIARCIGARQDFRALGSQPNGTLAFHAPTALSADLERLSRTGATFTSIATSSDRCFVLPAGTESVRIAELADGSLGSAEPPRSLVALIRPDDPTHGSVAVAASAAPFGDLGLADPNFVHAELVRVLVRGLASSERRALAAVARTSPTPLADATTAQRWTSRALCVALVPLLLVLIGIARGAISVREFGGRTVRLGALALLACGVIGVATLSIGTRTGLEAARDSVHAIPAELAGLAASAGQAGATITAVFSGSESLPPALRPLAREIASRCQRLARTTHGLEFRERTPSATNDAADLRVRALERTSDSEEGRVARSFHASLVVESGDRRRVLDFADAAAFEHSDFRIALALRDVTTGERTRIAFASEPSRVTPAEALEHYQKRGLFAPGTGDPFAAARALLEGNGFDVRRDDPTRADDGSVTADALLVWMQPLRDATTGARKLARHLAAGGRALVAAQQYRVRPRARSDGAGDAALWPEPLFPDVDRLWLPAIGITLRPELVLDAQSGVLRTRGTREREGRVESVTMDLANALVVRSTPASRPPSAYTAGVGDLLMQSPAHIELDAARLREHALIAQPILTTSDRAWTAPWSGGDVPPSAFEPAGSTTAARTLGVLVEGRFPGPNADPRLEDAPREERPAGTGRLVLYGTSEPFTEAYLATDGADHARLLLQTCAALALPPEFADLLALRPTVGGYRALDADQRLRARAITLASGPALVLLLAFAWRTWRGRRAGAAAVRAWRSA